MSIQIDVTKTQTENAILNNCSGYKIKTYCNKQGIKLKDGRGKIPNVSINPFDYNTIDGQYWLGYFLGDGIYGRKNLGICSKDYDIVKDFHNYCNNTNKIYLSEYQVDGKLRFIYKSIFGFEDVYNYLKSVGISFQNRKLDTKFNLPLNWTIIRGLFDADGSLSKNQFKITTSNIHLKNLLLDFFHKYDFVTIVYKKSNSYDVLIKRKFYHTQEKEYIRLYKLLYQDGQYSLKRKKENFAALVGDI